MNTHLTTEDELRARIRDLEAALKQNDKSLAITFKLPPVLSNLLGLLLSVPIVTPEMVRQRLEITTDAKVAMHRLRNHLKPWDIKIHSRRNIGYWIEADDKHRIKAMLTPEVSAETPDEPSPPPAVDAAQVAA